jgi:hypothetical protein
MIFSADRWVVVSACSSQAELSGSEAKTCSVQGTVSSVFLKCCLSLLNYLLTIHVEGVLCLRYHDDVSLDTLLRFQLFHQIY